MIAMQRMGVVAYSDLTEQQAASLQGMMVSEYRNFIASTPEIFIVVYDTHPAEQGPSGTRHPPPPGASLRSLRLASLDPLI